MHFHHRRIILLHGCLPQPMNLIKVVPMVFDYLDSDLKKEELSGRQHYVV
ncbi:MAG: hypothetical protein J6M45_13920 [Pseudobutyrivibrio sp.]|nr:hypothetical protein [Pseudobutyrivibrio sp.]